MGKTLLWEVSEKLPKTTSETSDYTDFKEITQILGRGFNLCNRYLINVIRDFYFFRLFQKSLWALIIMMAFALTGCAREKEVAEVSLPAEESTAPEAQRIVNFSLTGYAEGGKRRWELFSDAATISRTGIIKLDNIVTKVYDEEGSIVLRAAGGTFDKLKGDVVLQKDVVVTTSDGARLTSEYLDWSQEHQCITTDTYILVEKDNIECTGKGMYAEPNLKQIELKKDVIVKIDPATIITCDGPLEIDYEKNMATFNKNVKAQDDRILVFGDKMDVFFDPESKTIIKIVVVGNVKPCKMEMQPIVSGQSTPPATEKSF